MIRKNESLCLPGFSPDHISFTFIVPNNPICSNLTSHALSHVNIQKYLCKNNLDFITFQLKRYFLYLNLNQKVI